MNCPYCGHEMKVGAPQGPGDLYPVECGCTRVPVVGLVAGASAPVSSVAAVMRAASGKPEVVIVGEVNKRPETEAFGIRFLQSDVCPKDSVYIVDLQVLQDSAEDIWRRTKVIDTSFGKIRLIEDSALKPMEVKIVPSNHD